MKNKPLKRSSRAGFTLLEVLIALALMVVVFGSILTILSNSLVASGKTKQTNVVSMLARNLFIESEQTWEGKTFSEIKKEETGEFPEPHNEYRWKREVKEVEFPQLGTAMSGNPEGESGGGAQGSDQASTQMSRLVSDYLSKAIREVKISILWTQNGKEYSYVVSTYWVNLNNEFRLSL